MTMNVLVTKEQRYSPYALRSKNQRYPLRSISNACRRTKSTQQTKIPDTVDHHVSKLKFSRMNDNCILYVLENLSLADLCSVAEVSVRLKRLAQYTFRVKYKHELNLNLLADGSNKITMKQARSLFYNFGQYIKSLHVSRKQFEFDSPLQRPFLGQQKLFHLISKYCSLETLTIGHFWFNVELIHEALPTFAKLRTLNFYRIICYCMDEKVFHHFANVLPAALVNGGHPTPQIVQLI